MKKEEIRLSLVILGLILIASLSSVIVTSGDNLKEDERFIDNAEMFEGYEDETLKVNAGTTPESSFYFIDKFFDRFGDDLKVKEERIAEIKAMVESGNIEAAREALKDYKKLAEELEQEIAPDKREDALRSASAIRNAIREIQDRIPEKDRNEFVDEIIKKEQSIATSAEIASKIKELCKELAELDPNVYYKTCRTEDDSPKWQKKLHKDLTKEQKKEAEKFGKIMSECFKTSGQNCRCEEIPFTEFAKTCSIASPLATACDIDEDETACKKLENLKMPELPGHLQDVFDTLEREVLDAKFEMHMPQECTEAGATSPKECSKIMIRMHAPEECKDALLKADVSSEKEGREICDKIMMEQHAPECVEKGITDPEECKDFMFSIERRPKECAEQGIHDMRDCQKFLEEDSFRRGGPDIGGNCRGIEDSMKRLECYDKASSQAKGFDGVDDENYQGPCLTDEDWKAKKAECREKFGQHAGDEPIMGDSGEGYECPVDIRCIDFGQYKDDDEKDGEYYEESECKDGCNDECPGASRTDCINGRCECYYDTEEDEGDESDSDSSPFEEAEGDELGGEGEGSESEDSESQGGEADESAGSESSGSDSGSSESGGDTSGDDSDVSTNEDSGGDTGITGNAFLDYWFE